jgi:hypothetical protein
MQARLARILARDASDRPNDPGLTSDWPIRAGVHPPVEPHLERVDPTFVSPPRIVASDAHLEGVRLAALEVAQLVNDDLTNSVVTLDQLRSRDDVPLYVQAMVDQALEGLYRAARHVEQLQRVSQVVGDAQVDRPRAATSQAPWTMPPR